MKNISGLRAKISKSKRIKSISKRKSSVRASLAAIVALGLIVGLPLQASGSSSLTAGDTSISWDATRFYEPDGCTRYDVSYSQTSRVNFSKAEVRNRFGDSLDSAFFFGTSGTDFLQICSFQYDRSEGPFKIVLSSSLKFSYGGATQTAEASLTFISRDQPATVDGVAISGPSTVTAGESAVYIVTVTDADGNGLEGLSVSMNEAGVAEINPGTAITDARGEVRTTLVTSSTGNSYITATVGGKSQTLIVEVVAPAEPTPEPDGLTQFSNYDSFTPNQPANFDLNYLSYQEFDTSPGVHFFGLFTKGRIVTNQFNDGLGSFGMVLLDENLDGVADYRIQTTETNLVSNFFNPAEVFVESTGEPLDCSAQFYSDIDDGVKWLAMTIDYACLTLPTQFGIQAYLDYRGGDDSFFAYLPDGYGEFFIASHSFQNSSGSSATPAPPISTKLPSLGEKVNDKVANPSQPPLALENLSPQVLESVVTIFCGTGLGSGWAADVNLSQEHTNAGMNSFIVTNEHVISDCKASRDVALVLTDGTRVAGKVVSWDIENDLAGIVTSANLAGLTWRGETPSQGWWVGVLGAPRGISGYLTTGLISIVSSDLSEIGTTSPVNPGNSGGPVFDREGRVLGTVFAKVQASEGLGFAKAAPLLCVKVVICPSSLPVWSSNPSGSASEVPDDEFSGEVVEGKMLLQRAGSQVFVTSADLQGSFEIYEDGVLIDSFTFDGANQAHIVEQRVTGAIQIRKIEGESSTLVSYELTNTLLWYQNVNLGSFSETNLGSSAREKLSNLVNHRYLESGSWKQRDSKVTKFICTGIYREGGSAAEKLSARKRAKLACESAKSLDNNPNSQVSFFYQTKETKAASYVGKVLVTVKGIEPFVAARIN